MRDDHGSRGGGQNSSGGLPHIDFSIVRSRKRALLGEQRAGWETGQPPSPEELLSRWPSDPQNDPDVASMLVEDFFQKRQRGEEPSLEDFGRRFPDHSKSLTGLLSCRDAFRSLGETWEVPTRSLRLPDVGDDLFGFRLRHPLGSGAFARVFLAEQADLAGRPVVLKISAIEGTEPQTLAQLQHTNIVPIYSVHEDERAGLRAVCMPNFGGASLSSVLQQLWSESENPHHGRQLVAALETVKAPSLASDPEQVKAIEPTMDTENGSCLEGQTPLTLLSNLNFIQATAWLVVQLAEGLQHAHQRGILHRDIKPSNILLSAEGQPLLLDFNLARSQRDDPAQATLGGTVAYMAPEHLRALAARSSALIDQVDRRSDIYSLGMVLAEMLTGHRPFEQSASFSIIPLQIEAMAVERCKAAPSLREQRPEVPWSLESIVRKCLAPEPSERYQQAEHLAEDLRRFLEDGPLKYAPELSRVERVRKFIRRHPRLTSSGSITAAALVAIVAIGSGFVGAREHLVRTQATLGEVQARQRLQAHDAGTVRALCMVNTTIEMQNDHRGGIAACEDTLALYDWPSGPHPDFARLKPEERRRVAEDRRELLIMLAGTCVRVAPDNRRAFRRAMELLDRAEAIGGLRPSRALWSERSRYLELLGETEQAAAARRKAETIPAADARDHYLLATSYARRGGTDGYIKAIEELDKALHLDPCHYWSMAQRGICHLELGETVLAAGDFGTCIGLWPESSWGYFNRGYVLDLSGRKAEAVQDYTAAISHDPEFVPAYVNRGLARLELKRFRQALADFDKALDLGRDDASIHAGRGLALEALGKHPEADQAFERAFARVGARPDPARARLCWTYGFSVSSRLPDQARAAFDDVLLQDPGHPQALYGRAMLAMRQERLDEALRFFDRAVEANPGFVEARRYRGVLLARLGDWDRASSDVNWCLERDPKSGPTLYAAACVAARAAGATGNRSALVQALNLLQHALTQGAGLEEADTDPDLASIRQQPEFRRLLSQAIASRKSTAAPSR
jgi:serine/threonine protein kinase/tetratricopeptide (TPR) repeat protein